MGGNLNRNKGIISIGIILILILMSLFFINKENIVMLTNKSVVDLGAEESKENEDKPIEEIEESEHMEVDKSIKILSLGNIIIHQAQLDGAKTDNGYDFSPSFSYIKDMVENADLSLGILETTLSDGEPSGYPWFNSPDEIIDNLKNTGLDVVNYANNHINDFLDAGFNRTIEVTKEKGLDVLGIKEDVSDKDYIIKDVKGEKIGLIAYVFETEIKEGQKTINNNILTSNIINRINTFNYSELEEFYSNIENQIKLMKDDGAKFIITSMHWGEEYDTCENQQQKEIAERLNKLGVDIILGGHPHVIQPYEEITGEDGHKTFVIYSQGNSLSNQSEEEIGIAESEDGIIAEFNLEQENDKLILKDYEMIPTWVYKESKDGGLYNHRIIPVEEAMDDPQKYNIKPEYYEKLKKSLDRTISIIGNTEGQNN